LDKASCIYEALVAHMAENWSCFPYWTGEYRHGTGWRLHVEQTDSLGQRIPAYSDEWTTDMRRQGIDVLKALKQKDEEALALLQELV